MIQKHTIPAEWSRRRTRHDPAGMDDAIAAARGLTDCVESQIEIAAQLIGLPEDEVRPAVLETAARFQAPRVSAIPIRQNAGQTIVVERRSSRARLR
jgi:hypothetical protein